MINTKSAIQVLFIALLLSMLMLFAQVYLNKRAYEDYKKLEADKTEMECRMRKYSDSLREEVLILETEVNRYRIALEMLEDENPSAASEFDKRLSMTE